MCRKTALALLVLASVASLSAAEPAVINVWPGDPPGESGNIGPEEIVAPRPDDASPTLRITNVTRPTLTVYRAASGKDTHAAVVVCPGGGHRILAWDKEGTEVAEWLNSIGVDALVLKYRVPTRDEQKRWQAAVQDAQRAMSLVRSRANEWHLDPQRIGILGFSAGGETAALTSLFERQYEPVDTVNDTPYRPDFAAIIYPGGLVDRETRQLRDYVRPTPGAPPMFLAQAFDDNVRVENSVLLFLKLKEAGVPADLHVYATGGHGFGLRPLKARGVNLAGAVRGLDADDRGA